MKKIGYLLSSTGAIMLTPLLALAAGGFADNTVAGTGLANFVTSTTTFVNTYLIPLVMALAFLAFIWGMFQYFIVGGGNDEAKEKGKSLMIWATLGFVMIIILWGLVNFIATSIGLEGETIAIPSAPTGNAAP
jgi:hypothetical protein